MKSFLTVHVFVSGYFRTNFLPEALRSPAQVVREVLRRPSLTPAAVGIGFHITVLASIMPEERLWL